MKRTYSEMKDSGVEWIGEIPKEWGIIPAGQAFGEVKDKNIENRYDNPFSFKYGEIVNKKIGHIDENQKMTLRTYTIVKPNTITVNGLNLNYDFVTQRVAIVNDFGIITSAYLAINPNKEFLFPRFAMYMLKSFDYQQVFHGCGNGIRKTLKFQDFKEIFIIIPSLSEQTAIANYLDAKCAEIDSMISEAKNCIEEYRQWKSSVIFEAVTKGLDPNAEMKDSGIEWIGEIPKEWEIIKIKNVAYLDPNCYKPFESCEVSFAPMNCIRTNQRIEKVALLSADNDSYSSFNNGDIVLAKVSPCFENKNVCIMDNLKNMYAFGSSELFNLRPFNVITRFLLYWLQTDRFVENGVACMTGVAGLKRIPSWYVKNAYITYPSLSEQTTIANYLDEKCAQIDEVISEKEALILDLELYKKSLIYEVVTGKIKVS